MKRLFFALTIAACNPTEIVVPLPDLQPDPITDLAPEPEIEQPICEPGQCPEDLLLTPMHAFFGSSLAGDYISVSNRAWEFHLGHRISEIETISFHTSIIQYGRRDFLVELGLTNGTFQTYCASTDTFERFQETQVGLRRGCLTSNLSNLRITDWHWVNPYTAEFTICIYDGANQARDCGQFQKEAI